MAARVVWLVGACSALLLGLAWGFDFFCDDAYIVLRYAQNIARGHGAVYNPGEPVEGYTSATWLLLAVPGALLGVPLPRFVQAIGALSGVGLLAATAMLWSRLRLPRFGLGALVLLALALSAPVAAWTLGGLETPLFAALVTFSFALAIDVADMPTVRNAVRLAVALGLSLLTRPEGMLVAAVIGLVLLLPLARSREGRVALAWVIAGLGTIAGAQLLFRLNYYGYPLPNTFYVKSSGDNALLRLRGMAYLHLAAVELAPVIACAAIGLLGAGRLGDGEGARGRRLLAWIGRLLLPGYAYYVRLVGGDFLDLYRFFVPLFPLTFVLAASAIAERTGRYVRGPAALVLGATLVCAYGAHQHALAERAKLTSEPARAQQGVEPLGWTRLYALRWAAMGRWIARHAEVEDWMVVGAAGAMPYYAGLRNLDTFGLTDAWVAHHAPVVGDRPGHQRFAPLHYMLSKRPVFVLHGRDYTSDVRRALRRDAAWEARGYRWVEARVTRDDFGAPADYFHYFLMRDDRVAQRSASGFLRAEP